MFFFVGIKGSGMSSLALILNDLGYEVCGFDYDKYFQTQDELEKRNIAIYNEILDNKDYIYIMGNAFAENLICNFIYENDYLYYNYNEFIDYFFRNKVKIAVSGTHGKTTTTKLLSTFLRDTSYLIGDGTGKGIIHSKYFLFEACEYKNTFLKYHPDYLIITNIDLDHIDFYKNIESVIESFISLTKNSKVVIINNECFNSKKLDIPNKITFGKTNSDYIYEIVDDKNGFDICIKNRDEEYFYYHLDFYGEYMVENFVASFVVLDLLKEDKKDLAHQIKNFQMPRRRMNEQVVNQNIFISDYGHHPKEIAVTIKSIKRKYPNKILYTIFEPHTYTRFHFFLEEIKTALNLSDFYYITKIFSSEREKRTDKDYLLEYVNFDEEILKEILKLKEIIILFIGAGEIDKLFMKTVENFKK